MVDSVAFPSPATIVSIASGVPYAIITYMRTYICSTHPLLSNDIPVVCVCSKKKKRHARVTQHTHIHVTPTTSIASSSHAIEHHHQQQHQHQQTKLASVVDNSNGSNDISDNDTQCVGAVVLYWINIGVSCCTEYAIPALLPYLTGHDGMHTHIFMRYIYLST